VCRMLCVVGEKGGWVGGGGGGGGGGWVNLGIPCSKGG